MINVLFSSEAFDDDIVISLGESIVPNVERYLVVQILLPTSSRSGQLHRGPLSKQTGNRSRVIFGATSGPTLPPKRRLRWLWPCTDC